MSTLKYRDSNNDYQGFHVKVTDTLPVGSVYLWGGITAPSGYLICDGRAVSRTEYADLFKVIGTNFGSGDGLTTFNIPDYRGRVPVGVDINDVAFDTIGEVNPICSLTGSGEIQSGLASNFIIKASNKVALERGNVVDSLTGEDTDSAPSVRAVKEAFQLKGQVLWTNPSSTSPFAGQTITLINNDYDYIDIIFNNFISRDTYNTARIYNINGNFELDVLFNYQGNIYAGSRYAQFTDNGNKIAFEDAYGKETSTSGNATIQTSWAVPYKIIGYKS